MLFDEGRGFGRVAGPQMLGIPFNGFAQAQGKIAQQYHFRKRA